MNTIHFDDNPIGMDFVERFLADIQQQQQLQPVENEPAAPPGTILKARGRTLIFYLSIY